MEHTGSITAITDIGVDDALALALLDKLAGSRKKVISSTFGNTSADIIESNAHEFAAYMQHDWYFHQGTRLPLNGLPATFSAEDYHGTDGLWGVRPPKSSSPPKIAKSIPDGQIISLGPLTQAYGLLKERNLTQVTLMGGYFKSTSNATIRAQANIHMDIDAAEAFFNECAGAEVKVVPHEVTRNVYWSREQIEKIPDTSVTNRWLKDLMRTWFEHCPYQHFALHDPVAVLLAFEPDSAHWVESGVRVLRGGNIEGITELSKDNPVCNIAVGLDDSEKTARRIFSLIFDE